MICDTCKYPIVGDECARCRLHAEKQAIKMTEKRQKTYLYNETEYGNCVKCGEEFMKKTYKSTKCVLCV